MLRKLVALSIIAMVAATAFGAAASLSFDGGTIQFGVDDSLICDPNGVQVNWFVIPDIDLVFLDISDIAPECFGNELGWAFEDGQGSIVDDGVIHIEYGWAAIGFQADVAGNIEVLKLWITGPHSLAPPP